jgi:hypothetical protein
MASCGMLRRVALILCISSQLALVASYGYVPSSPILVTLMTEALSSSETSVLSRATWRNSPEDAILYSHRHGNLKSYIQPIALHILGYLLVHII